MKDYWNQSLYVPLVCSRAGKQYISVQYINISFEIISFIVKWKKSPLKFCTIYSWQDYPTKVNFNAHYWQRSHNTPLNTYGCCELGGKYLKRTKYHKMYYGFKFLPANSYKYRFHNYENITQFRNASKLRTKTPLRSTRKNATR